MSPRGFPTNRPSRRTGRTRLCPSLAAILGGLALVGGAAFVIRRINRNRKRRIDEPSRIEEALRESEERYRLLADVAFEGILVHQGGIALDVNVAFTRIFGFSKEEVLGRNLIPLITHPEDIPIIIAQVERDRVSPYEVRALRKDGTVFPMEIEARNMVREGRKIRVAALRDITDRKQAEERILHMAQHDPLTDLPNRVLFSDRLERAMALAGRNRARLALMFLDLDKFKPVNDTYGHAVGDLLLKEAAERMRNCLRASDTVGRIGGDEFVVLLPLISAPEDAILVAEKLRSALERPFELAGHHLQVSSSIGIAVYPDQGSDEIRLAHHADQAMYWAKQGGGNRVETFREEMRNSGLVPSAMFESPESS
jgi:diguanylate cyclase (GGDEF)-like protein/PAS domain S-box-containing protein